MKKIYITTSIPYVNGRPHIGHALELVQADAFVRSYREEGYDAFLLTGTDENAQKNVESAEKAGIPTAQLVEQNSNLFQDLTKVLNVTNDDFIRTTSKKHFQGAQKLWQACLKDI